MDSWRYCIHICPSEVIPTWYVSRLLPVLTKKLKVLLDRDNDDDLNIIAIIVIQVLSSLVTGHEKRKYDSVVAIACLYLIDI